MASWREYEMASWSAAAKARDEKDPDYAEFWRTVAEGMAFAANIKH